MLSAKEPALALTRLQSGIGALTVEAVCSDAVGDLRLGCAYRLVDGQTSVVQQARGVATGPAKGNRPVLLGHRQQYERITVDLAQVRAIDRLGFYGYSESGGEIAWGGTLVVTTFGGSRVELPMDREASTGPRMLLTAYAIEGELVCRAEPFEPATTVREACLAFGFDRITWLDPNNPVT